jgi:hypothetical protein
MEKHYQSFIKFGEKVYMEKLFYKGEVFFNTINHFSEEEYNDSRTDKYDGADYIIQGTNLKVKCNNQVLATADNCQVYRRNLDLTGNIYCFYGIENNDLKVTDSFEKMSLNLDGISWGDTAVFIYDTKEFLRRVRKVLESKALEFKISPIIYYDHKTFNGKLTPFHKRKELFEKQKEIRYWIPNKINQIQNINIGNISDISFIIAKDDIRNIEYDYK